VPACLGRFLWDSQTTGPIMRRATTGVFAGFRMNPVGQPLDRFV